MNFIKKYRHGFLILIYALSYLCCFHYLEIRPVYAYHLVHCRLDDLIPFCEYFIVPYLLWFPYQIVAVGFFVFFDDDHRDYYRLCFNLMMGMSIFLAVSWLYPNGHLLRPDSFPRDNFFTGLVAWLYGIDTPTNILPSIHVFNSLAIHMALVNCRRLADNRVVQTGSFILTSLIVLSTMFLKQHSVVDVLLGSTMAGLGYVLFYAHDRYARTRTTHRTPARLRL